MERFATRSWVRIPSGSKSSEIIWFSDFSVIVQMVIANQLSGQCARELSKALPIREAHREGSKSGLESVEGLTRG